MKLDYSIIPQEASFSDHGPKRPAVEMAVVAFYNDHTALIVWTNDGLLRFEINEISNGDMVDSILDKDGPDHGIWIWEGIVHISSGGYYDCEPPEPEYHTKCWRQPTPEEWEAIMEQRNPFEPPPPKEQITWGHKTTI